jgi:asparagine synthase (glutamine-hydrolysing)
MCGIAGIVSLREGLAPPSREALARMAGALFHRGPDEHGLYRDAHAGLAHARLSIIDPAGGQQPLGSLDGSVQVVYNGEIFNHVELREELAKKGRVFRTRSDTEVVLAAWEAWGEDAFARMNGQFAVALWDARGKRLCLARDRLGVRPLHLLEHGGRLFFASEVKALFAADAGIPRALDPRGLLETFTFWSVLPPRSVFRGVTELRPGHVRVVEARSGDARGRERAFWRPRYAERSGAHAFRGSIEDATSSVLAALTEATRLRMVRADVPVGAYLSGGLDSSLIAALGARARGDRFQTFSLRFADAEYDETAFQRLMVRHLGSDHHEVTVSRADIAAAFPAVVAHTERPILRTAPAPLFLLSRLVRGAGIKVVLTGEGADEMFGGYDLFREGKVRRFWARAPASKWRPLLLDRLYPYLARSPVAQRAMAMQFFGRDLDAYREPGFAHGPRWHSAAALTRLFSPALRAELQGVDVVAELLATLPEEFPRWDFLQQDQYLEIRTLLTGYLLASQGDRMLMGNSVEGRFPFLDKEVVALADSLPAAFKLKVLDEKHILKRAALGLVPEEIVARKKQPYRAPDALAFAGPGAPAYVAEALSEEAVRRAGVFDPRAAALVLHKLRAGRDQFSNADNMAVVGLLSTQLLHQELVESPPAPRSVEIGTLVDRAGDAP